MWRTRLYVECVCGWVRMCGCVCVCVSAFVCVYVMHMKGSCLTCVCVMSHIWKRLLAKMDESCHTLWMSHVTHYGWVMSHMWMRKSKYEVSCHTFECENLREDSWVQGGEDSWDPLSCRSFSTKEPLNIGHVCGKWPMKIRDPMSHRHPVCGFVLPYIHTHTWHWRNVSRCVTWLIHMLHGKSTYIRHMGWLRLVGSLKS